MFDRESLKQSLLENKIDALLVTSIPNIIYLTSYSAFSTEERETFVLLTKSEQYILTDARYSEAVIDQIPHFKLSEINHNQSLIDNLNSIIKKHEIKTLGFESSSLTVREFAHLKKGLASKLKPTSNIIESKRVKKSQVEINKIKKACALGDKAFSYILKRIKQGMSEKEAAFLLDFFIYKQGAKPSFPTIVAFGTNASTPHHLSSGVKLDKQTSILMDFGVKLDNYCSDMTRVVFVKTPTSEETKIYNVVLDANTKAIEFLKSSIVNPPAGEAGRQSVIKPIKASDIDQVARSHIISRSYPSIPHSLGHGVGVEIHESPRLSPNSKDKLEEGMVFSIEPGIYIPKKIGVRIEDLVAINNGKAEILTKSTKEIVVIKQRE